MMKISSRKAAFAACAALLAAISADGYTLIERRASFEGRL